jgi:hypothetical protein
MKNIIPFLLLTILFSSCNKKRSAPPTCPILFCPVQLPILVTYVNKDDSAVVVKDYRVIDLRTNKPITTDSALMLKPGTYLVSGHNENNLFSAAGDNVQVTATDSLTNQTKTVIFKIAFPACSCGIIKISGPDTVKFN